MSGPDQKRVGDRIRELRRERGLTQEELGARTKVSAIHISRIERGEVDGDGCDGVLGDLEAELRHR